MRISAENQRRESPPSLPLSSTRAHTHKSILIFKTWNIMVDTDNIYYLLDLFSGMCYAIFAASNNALAFSY